MIVGLNLPNNQAYISGYNINFYNNMNFRFPLLNTNSAWAWKANYQHTRLKHTYLLHKFLSKFQSNNFAEVIGR